MPDARDPTARLSSRPPAPPEVRQPARRLAASIVKPTERFLRIQAASGPAVMEMIATVIRSARARGCTIGICGQAPSDYPEFARFPVEQGIDSISLNPDAVLKTLPVIAEAERAGVGAGGGTPAVTPIA